MLDFGFAEFLHRRLSLSFKAQCLPQIERGLCLAGCHVVAQTQGLSPGSWVSCCCTDTGLSSGMHLG